MSNAQSGMRFDAGIQYCGTKCLNRFIYRKYWVTTILIFCSMVVTYISVLVSGGLLVSSFVSVLVKYCVLVIISYHYNFSHALFFGYNNYSPLAIDTEVNSCFRKTVR